MASSTQDNVNLAQGVPTVAVGHTLKTARELTGKNIDEVAEQLRIRQAFLQALEDGRHKDLPGGTYAVGFLRTYAEFLGLDGEEMVRRFRAEAAGELNARSELVFPSPVSEGRIPGGAVLFLGVLLAGVAYGGWYFLSSRHSDVAEMVPPLPDRLASALNRPAAVTGETAKPVAEPPKTEEAQPKAEDAHASAPVAAAKEGEVVPPAEDDEAKPSAPATVAGTPTPSPTMPTAPVAVPKADPVKLEAAKADAPKAEPAKPAAPPTPATPPVSSPSAAPATATPPAPPPATPAAAVPAPAPAPTAAPAAAPTVPEGKVIGQENVDARIQLKASVDDCWVQVRESDGQLLLSRLLRRGDSFMVPNRPGLTLMVGNAGALEIHVDGRKAPALGAAGQVRRDIKLDPEKLAAGG